MFSLKTTTTNYVKAHYSAHNMVRAMMAIEYVLSLANSCMSESGETHTLRKQIINKVIQRGKWCHEDNKTGQLNTKNKWGVLEIPP